MITEHDLDAAIVECQGQRSPNANTCIKLAAYYILKNEMYGRNEGYSYSPPPQQAETEVEYDSGTEFAKAVNGKTYEDVLAIVDELMTTLQVVNPRLYESALVLFQDS